MNNIKLLFLPGLLLLLISCAPSITVNSDYNENAKFNAYSTFDVRPEPAKNNDPVIGNEINQKRIKQALISQMKGKGYKLDPQNPDFILTFSTDLQEKEEAQNYFNYYGGFWGPRNNSYMRTYEQGRLIVNMIDSKSKELLWQGYAIGEVRPIKKAQKKEEYINYLVAKIMQEYNYRASADISSNK